MALRNIRTMGDEVLGKKCKVVDKIDEKIFTLLDDMAETMEYANGVGLAAPQVGILKRIVVIKPEEELIEMINPEIVSVSDDTVNDTEGCLSVPGQWGYVERPREVTVKYTDRCGKECTRTGEGLFARAVCHELDHLDGHLFVEKVTEFVEIEN